MTAYTAIVSFRHQIAMYIKTFDYFMPPSLLQIMKSADKELKSIQEFVERLDSSSRKRMNASLQQMAAATRKLEDEIFSQAYVEDNEIHDLKQEIHSFLEKLKKMAEYHDDAVSSPRDVLESEMVGLSDAVSTSRDDVSESEMVGLSDVYNKVKEELAAEWLNNNLLFLVGMAGIGKTTLAKKIFEDLDILELFDCRVWVTVGTEFEWEEIEQAIVAQVNPDAQTLEECLRDKRYLIVLDDVWDKDIQDHFSSFPYNSNKSRILLSTRLRFCPEAVQGTSRRINMRLLDKEESWLLLCDKVFGDQDSCPLELEEAGKQIAEKCDGLPLTIITVAEHLLKTQMDPKELWNEVALHKKHQLFTDAYDEISKVLFPSYDWLDQELKLSLLYVGIFPQYFEIPKSKLFNLWIAEDIIGVMESYTLEEIATACLEFLAFFSFIMIYKQSSSSFELIEEIIKTCGLHSSWWHFCQREARKSNFFYVLDCYEDGLAEIIKCQSRLSIHNNVLFAIKDVYNSIEENCVSIAHTLLCLGPYLQYQLPVCFGLKLLQKLDALNIRFYEFPLEVLELVELRYIALTFHGKLPPSISKLLELQFLIINRQWSIKSNGTPTYLPKEIWDLKDLKYLQVMGCDIPDLGDACWPNLLTISGVSNHSCTEGVFKRIPGLKKLGIQIELGPNDTEPLCCFNHISHLDELESLKCVVVNPECKPEIFTPLVPLSTLPLKLKKLSLSGMGYQWEDISIIASLPFLKELKLRCNAFQGPKCVIKENEFKNLYSLLIEDLDLVQLDGRYGSFQNIVCVSIKHCYKLKEVSFGSCQIISKIEVVDCSSSVAREMKQTLLVGGRLLLLEHLYEHSSWDS